MSDGPERDTLLRIFERMLAIRRFEEAVFELRQGGHFAGHYHLYIGQEATGAAAMAALDDTDLVFTTHRNHGHLIARGTDPGRALAEIIGRAGFGAINGVMNVPVSAARALAPSAASVIWIVSGSYDPVLWLLSLVCALGVLAFVIGVLLGRKEAARA